MSWIDILLLCLIAAVLIAALRKCFRDKVQGKTCGGDCTRCGQRCRK